jgi:hypothetical protein
MDRLSDMLMLVNTLVLIGFLAVTLALLGIAVTNRFRIRRVLLTWHAGRFFGLPLLPAISLLITTGLLVLFASTNLSIHPGLLIGYLIGGGFWTVASLLLHAVVVTEHGLLCRQEGRRVVIPWTAVRDYCEHSPETLAGWTFVYSGTNGTRNVARLSVPRRHRKRFRHVIAQTLDPRFDASAAAVYGGEALKK